MTDDGTPISCRPTLALSLSAAMQRTSSETLDTLGEQLRMSDAAVMMRRATAHAAVIRAVAGHRAGERPRLRASVRAVLGEARS